MPSYFMIPLETAHRLRDRLAVALEEAQNISPNGYKAKEVAIEVIEALLELLPEAEVVEAAPPARRGAVQVTVVKPSAGRTTVDGLPRNSGVPVRVQSTAGAAGPVRTAGATPAAPPAAPARSSTANVLEVPDGISAADALAALRRVGVSAEETEPHPVGKAMAAAAAAQAEHPAE